MRCFEYSLFLNIVFSERYIQDGLNYNANLILQSLWKQSVKGPYDATKEFKPGFFDVPGRDRM